MNREVSLDQRGATYLDALLEERPIPKGWTRLDAYNTFRSIHQPMTLIITARVEADGRLWVHISTAHRDRLPSWPELLAIRDWLLGPDRWAMQLLPPKAEHVNIHPNCLHLWHCVDERVVPDLRVGDQV